MDHGQLDIGHGGAGKSWIQHHEGASSGSLATELVKSCPGHVLHVSGLVSCRGGDPTQRVEVVMMSCIVGTWYLPW